MSESIGSVGRHKRVFETLKKQILKSKVGSRLDSISGLAQRFSVSPITVRHALLLLAKEGLVELKHGSGTYVCEHADKRHVGVFLDLDISMPEIALFWGRVAQQVRLGLRAHGYRTRFYPGNCRPGEDPVAPPCLDLVEDVAEDRLCGLVAVWGSLLPESSDALQTRQVPCVGSFKDSSHNFDAVVKLDFEQAVREGTRRLLEAGRRKLAYLEWTAAGDPRQMRGTLLDAFASELARQGLALNEHWVRRDMHPTLRGAGWAAFREIWAAAADKPDGLLVTDDALFQSAATAIQELGIRVPEQLRVVTHTNKGADYHCPFPVWRMEADPDAFAQTQVELMVALLRGQPVAQPQVVLPLQFIAPESTVADRVGARETEPVTKEGSSVS